MTKKEEKWIKQGERLKLLLIWQWKCSSSSFLLFENSWFFFFIPHFYWHFEVSPLKEEEWMERKKWKRISSKSFCSNFHFKAAREFFILFYLFFSHLRFLKERRKNFLSFFEYSFRIIIIIEWMRYSHTMKRKVIKSTRVE